MSITKTCLHIPFIFQNDEQANERLSSAAYTSYVSSEEPDVQRTQRLKDDG